MTETASVLTYQTIETYVPGSVGRMISGIDAIVTDEGGRGMHRIIINVSNLNKTNTRNFHSTPFR